MIEEEQCLKQMLLRAEERSSDTYLFDSPGENDGRCCRTRRRHEHAASAGDGSSPSGGPGTSIGRARNERSRIYPNSQSAPTRHRDPEQVVGKNILVGINCDGLYRRTLSGAAQRSSAGKNISVASDCDGWHR